MTLDELKAKAKAKAVSIASGIAKGHQCDECGTIHRNYESAEECCRPEIFKGFFCEECGIDRSEFFDTAGEASEHYMNEHLNGSGDDAYIEALRDGYRGGCAMFEFEQRFISENEVGC